MASQTDLTENQRAAVEHFDGPLLVLAGPGSGKTRVITRRIARLIERDVDPRHILAITFTNKAAREMLERVRALKPDTPVWISTFHRFCARVLRRHAPAVGLQANFTILDQSDQKQLLRQVISDLDHDATRFPIGEIAARISRAKNQLHSARDFAERIEQSHWNPLDTIAARAYVGYQQALLRSNAVDFDDLLLHVATILTENPDIRSQLDARFRYILVDEYQDTNLAQYTLVAALSVDQRNLCATGDPDQSIYGWRGADIDNILRFEQDFPNAKVVRLEENFRSTQSILKAADSLISRNVYRKAKSLSTINPPGIPVELLSFEDASNEADEVVRSIRIAVEERGRSWADFAFLYRVNALSRRIEVACARQRVPYQVAAGLAFYERTEVKDLMAYLRLVQNPNDLTAFQRVVNTPVRGIGKQTQAKLLRWAEAEHLGLLEAATHADRITGLGKRAVLALKHFAGMMAEFSLSDTGSVEGLLRRIIDRTGYAKAWEHSQAVEDEERLANVGELLNAAHQYDEETQEEASLESFLETSSLVSDVDAVNPDAGRVTLMTLHAAKGLEFPVVYILGVEHNLIPHERSLQANDPRELEEERRLLFVGMTRAKEELYLTQAKVRDMRGKLSNTIPSLFLTEMELHSTRFERSEEQMWRDLCGPGSEHDAADDSKTVTVAASESVSRLAARPLLTTAANLLNGSSEPARIPFAFTLGMLVRHPRNGRGTVVDVGVSDKRRTVTVEFDNGERASFVANKCPLQPIGMK